MAESNTYYLTPPQPSTFIISPYTVCTFYWLFRPVQPYNSLVIQIFMDSPVKERVSRDVCLRQEKFHQ